MTRLTTTQAEADDQIMATRLANSRRTDTQEQIDTVKTELGQVNGEKTAETQERYDRILKLKNDLDEVERATEQQKVVFKQRIFAHFSFQQQVMETTNAEKQKIITKSDNLQQQMIDQITPLTTDHKKLVTQHREGMSFRISTSVFTHLAELEVRQRKFRLETEVDGLIAKYDDFMITQQDDIGVIQEEYDVEKEQLDELRARYEKLKVISLMIDRASNRFLGWLRQNHWRTQIGGGGRRAAAQRTWNEGQFWVVISMSMSTGFRRYFKSHFGVRAWQKTSERLIQQSLMMLFFVHFVYFFLTCPLLTYVNIQSNSDLQRHCYTGILPLVQSP